MPSLLVTGGGGFVGSHVAERFAKEGWHVIVFDSLSRGQLPGKGETNVEYNWKYLMKYDSVRLVRGDVRDSESIEEACEDVDAVVHAIDRLRPMKHISRGVWIEKPGSLSALPG